MVNPDLQIKGTGRGGGGRLKKLYSALRFVSQFGLKIKGGRDPRAPRLDPPLGK